MLTRRVSDALALAVLAHENQVRKGTSIPYVAHAMGVAAIALEFGADEDQTIAALLHDVLEDGGPHYGAIIKVQFGDRVFAIVNGCTDGVPNANGEKGDWWGRKRAYLAHLASASIDVLLVSGSDKLHNARSIVNDHLAIGPDVFNRFKTGREGTLWYYRSLADVFMYRQSPIAPLLDAEVVKMERLT